MLAEQMVSPGIRKKVLLATWPRLAKWIRGMGGFERNDGKIGKRKLETGDG